jgi:glycosyltransferase involved in cell wall biosynthesis
MKIGYCADNYTQKRNIVGIVQGVNYVKVHDINAVASNIVRKCNKLCKGKIVDPWGMSNCFRDFDLNRVNLLHFFNTISFGKTPWITTFETILPRFRNMLACHHGKSPDFSVIRSDEKIKRAIEVMCNDSCKKLIAMSECALNIEKELLQEFPQYRSTVEAKLMQLHPPQELLVDSYAKKDIGLDGPIHFGFVGASFFRKGGVEVLETFRDLRKRNGYDLRLTIVSSLVINDYATSESAEDAKKVKELIQANSAWIDYHGQLPSQAVLAMMKKLHIGLLPTYADTYGYSVLEFQAAGCPVITTNVRALPEINNNAIGWLIDIPKNHLGEAIYITHQDRLQIRERIKERLESILNEIFSNRDVIIHKSNEAIKRIGSQHSRIEYAKKLNEIYHHALQ